VDNILNQNSGSPDSFENMFYWQGMYVNKPVISIVYGSPELLTGYSEAELLRKPGQLLSLVHPEDINQYKKALSDFISGNSGKRFSHTHKITTKSKDVVWVKEEIFASVDPLNNSVSLSGAIFNINEFKLKELELQEKSDHLFQLNSSKDRFISILSHDLRAPFTSILGFSEILMNDQNLSEAEKTEYLKYIHESSNNQLQLINYLLDWSRLQTGRIKVEPFRLNAQTLAYNCVSALTGNAIRKNVEIKVIINESLHIEADERLICQVITNLLSNAIKFSPENKKVEISADIFNDDKIEFIIKDEGVGIPEVNKEKIFKVDKMFSTEGTKGERGTGLGLSLVKEIVEKHNGNIWFYSTENTGSEFHFTVPSSKSSILIVENNTDARMLLTDNLVVNYPEYDVITAINAYEAMTLISGRMPSLIVTDHNLPFMDGIQFLKYIRENEKDHKVPVIAFVNDLTDEIKRSYYEYGINSILRKPVDLIVFHREINSALA